MFLKQSELTNLGFNITGKLRLPSVSVGEKLLLAVEQFFVINGCILIIWAFHDGINWAGLLTVSTINAFGHVDIVSGCSS
jgi:hypothetical protein